MHPTPQRRQRALDFSTARARHTQSHQLSAPQLLPYLDFDTARHRPDILTLSRGTNEINNPQFGDIFFLVWILDFSPTADSVATFFYGPNLAAFLPHGSLASTGLGP